MTQPRTPMEDAIRLTMPEQPGVNVSATLAGCCMLLACAVMAGCVAIGLLMAAGVIK